MDVSNQLDKQSQKPLAGCLGPPFSFLNVWHWAELVRKQVGREQLEENMDEDGRVWSGIRESPNLYCFHFLTHVTYLLEKCACNVKCKT